MLQPAPIGASKTRCPETGCEHNQVRRNASIAVAMKLSTLRLAACGAFAGFAALVCAAQPLDPLGKSFETPPDDARPTVRWWWYGPAVVKPQLEQEMKLMKAGGFGGFEVQPTYPLALDGQYPGLKNLKFLSPEFFDMLGFTAGKAKEIGLRMDLTLGSGWPYGGPMFTRDEAVQSIGDLGRVKIAAGQKSIEAPAPSGRGAVADAPVIAALLGPIKDPATGGSTYTPLRINGRAAELPADLQGATEVRFFGYAPAGLMQVKRAAYGDEGLIVDHYSPAAIEKFIRMVAEPSIAACGANPPFSIFCDSLEVAGEGWTPNLPDEFRRRRGYDLLPLLPALFDNDFPGAAEIRGDYGRTIAEVFNDAFADRFTKLAHDHRTKFRLQAYGTPPTTLTTYARVDISEGEGTAWRSFSGTRWASSASHLLGRPITSSESFTWLHSPVFMAAPIDIKAESNVQFLSGVNQLLYHGWPYTAPGVEYPGWRFYAAAVFNDRNPWWIVMPDVNRYLARTSTLLRQGTPANDIALYLPEEDAFTGMTPRNLQMVAAGGRGLLNNLVSPLVPRLLDAGYGFDGIDAGLLAARGTVDGATLAFGDVKYRVVVLPAMKRIAPAAISTLETFANQGGILIAVDAAPTSAPGFHANAADQKLVQEVSARLFSGPNARGVVVPADQLAATLAQKLTPDLTFSEPQQSLGFVHRHIGDTDLYFVANTSNQPVTTTAIVRATARGVEWWDADTARRTPARVLSSTESTTSVAVELPPFGAQFLVFSPRGSRADAIAPAAPATGGAEAIDLSADWDVAFKNAAPEPSPAATHYATLASWTEKPETKYFSGVATYVKQFEVPASLLKSGAALVLDFGSGEPATVAGGNMGMRANFQPPIGDAAVITINGKRAGALWCPPYRLDVSGLVHEGSNTLRIEVANRAVNFMADREHHPLPDYSALNANRELGGNRFQPQDMDRIQTTPSGLLGGVRLVAEAR